MRFIATVRQMLRDKRAVTALEYGLIASLIAVFIIGAIGTLGSNLSGVFNKVATAI